MNADLVRRIAIVKQLYGIATETAQKPNPLNAFSILPLHDSVEMFMQLAVEYKNAPLSAKAPFDQCSFNGLASIPAVLGDYCDHRCREERRKYCCSSFRPVFHRRRHENQRSFNAGNGDQR